MNDEELPLHLKQFIFEFIDSVELLDVLLLLNSDPEKTWDTNDLSATLCTNANSVEIRLNHLKKLDLILESASNRYRYNGTSQDRNALIQELREFNTTKRHRILRLIFSPLKQVRVLADGFRVSPKKTEGNQDG